MLVLMVLLLVIVDAVILSVYTALEANGEGASLVINREKEITVTGVRQRGEKEKGGVFSITEPSFQRLSTTLTEY